MRGRLRSSDVGILIPAERLLRKKSKIICLSSLLAMNLALPKPLGAVSASALQNSCINLRMSINIDFMCQDVK